MPSVGGAASAASSLAATGEAAADTNAINRMNKRARMLFVSVLFFLGLLNSLVLRLWQAFAARFSTTRQALRLQYPPKL